MEEDIKILEEFKTKGYSMLLMKYGDRNTTNFKLEQALEHLIKAYKELEEKNRKLKEHCKEQIKDKQELTTALLDSIPISLVEKKMEELKQQGNYKTLENPDGRVHFQAEPCDYKIQVLEELLEKRK